MILEIDNRTPPYFVKTLHRIAEQAAKRQFLNVLVLAHELEGAAIVCHSAMLKDRSAGLEVQLKDGGAPIPVRIIASDRAIRKAEEADQDAGGDGDGKNGKA